jgi:hypothetical protein
MNQVPSFDIRPIMRNARRTKWPSAKGVEDIIHYYEHGGAENDKFAKECYLGYVHYTDEDEGTII